MGVPKTSLSKQNRAAARDVVLTSNIWFEEYFKN